MIKNTLKNGKKPKPLLPTLKEKKRYLVYKVLSKKPVSSFASFADVSAAINSSFTGLFGSMGMADAGIMHLADKWNSSEQTGMLRINNKYVNHIKTALATAKLLKGEQIIIRSVGISGILKKAEEKFMKGEN